MPGSVGVRGVAALQNGDSLSGITFGLNVIFISLGYAALQLRGGGAGGGAA